MEDPLSIPFDFMVCGTGMAESALAAGLSGAGYRVVQVDKNGSYGTDWQSLNLKHWQTWADEHSDSVERSFESTEVKEEEISFNQKFDGFTARTILQPSGKIMELYRDFSIDMTPGFVTSRGRNVEIQAANGVSQYMGYKTLDNLFMGYAEGSEYKFQRIPCHKSDIFSDSSVGLMDKRRLMKFLEYAIDYQLTLEGQSVTTINEARLHKGRSLSRPQNKKSTFNFTEEDRAMTFGDFLQTRFKLSSWMQQVVAHGVGQLPAHLARPGGSSTLASAFNSEDGMGYVCEFLGSIGRYSSSPYLAPMYGTGDIPQAFARFAAVNGTIQLLGMAPLKATKTLPEEVKEEQEASDPDKAEEKPKTSVHWNVTCSGEKVNDGEEPVTLRVGHIIAHASYLPQFSTATLKGSGLPSVVRVMCITNKPVIPIQLTRTAQEYSEEEEILRRGGGRGAAVIPPSQPPDYAIQIIQTDASVNMAPSGYFLVYFSTLVDSSMKDKAAFEKEFLDKVSSFCHVKTTGMAAEEPSPSAKSQDKVGGKTEGPQPFGSAAGVATESNDSPAAPEDDSKLPTALGCWLWWQTILIEDESQKQEHISVIGQLNPFLDASPRVLEMACDTPITLAEEIFKRVVPDTPFLPGKKQEEQYGATEDDLREIEEIVPKYLEDDEKHENKETDTSTSAIENEKDGSSAKESDPQ